MHTKSGMTGDNRQPPDVETALQTLVRHRVNFVLIGSVAVQAWSADVGTPGDVDIVLELSRENLVRLAAVLRDLDAVPWPVTGRWQRAGTGEARWVSFPENHPLYGTLLPDPNPDDIATFDSLFATRHGAFDIVPEISGMYDVLITRSQRLTVHGTEEVEVMSLEDLLVRLTVPRREKDAPRVARLRDIQRQRLSAFE